jgi:hypothetical protein
MVAGRDGLYVQCEKGAAALDGATGEILRVYEMPSLARHIVLSKGHLVTACNGLLRALRAEDGEVLWDHNLDAEDVLVSDGRVFFIVMRKRMDVVCLDLRTGKQEWRSSPGKWAAGHRRMFLCFAAGGVLGIAVDGIQVLSAKDGGHLWGRKYKSLGHGGTPQNILFVDNLVWIHSQTGPWGKWTSRWIGLDPFTGKEKKSYISMTPEMQEKNQVVKQRCYRDRATERYILYGTMNFLDLETGNALNTWVAREGCMWGSIPANGLLYTPAHGCGCNAYALRGYLGLSSDPAEPALNAALNDTSRLEVAGGRAPAPAGPAEADWPMHRPDAARTASTSDSVPPPVKTTSLGLHPSISATDVRAWSTALCASWDSL